jgi:O-methyltransferase
VHLFPRLSRGGVLIVDDYGQYLGARKAADEYFSSQNMPVLLHRMDFSGRMLVKQ